ncbi:MAG: sugar phosphate isomerase/epimerase [Eubacteriales bacterium]
MKIGAQLFTVRDYCRSVEALAQTLQKIAQIGYTSVQVSGICPIDAAELRRLLDANGLTCDLTHYDFDRITGQTDAVIGEHRTMGCRYIGVGSMPGAFGQTKPVSELYPTFVRRARPAAAAIAAAGLYFMYHNHAFEYQRDPDGETYMQRLSDAFPPHEMGFTLDTYWVQKGGFDPVAEIRRLSGRVPCIHLKDMEKETERFAPVGSGVLDFPRILEAAEAAGTVYAFVEQDRCYEKDPFVCLQESYGYLTSLGYR